MQRIQRNNPSEGRRTTGLKASWLAHSELWLGKHKRKKREDSFGSFKVQLRLLLFLCFSACYGGFRPLLDPSRARFAPLWISPPVHLFFSRTLSVSKLVKPSDLPNLRVVDLSLVSSPGRRAAVTTLQALFFLGLGP